MWHDRPEFMNATAHAGPIILAAIGGPNEEEEIYLKNVPATQQIVLLHFSDEYQRQVDTSVYGPSVQQVFRQVKPDTPLNIGMQ